MSTIVQKFDRRKREKNFSIPILPLIILAILAIALTFLPGKIVSKVSSGTFLQLDKINYRGNQQLEGKFKINLSEGDFLPLNTNVTFNILAYFPWYYVCENGDAYKWCDANGTSLISNESCDPATILATDSPEEFFCNGNTALEPRSCLAYDKKCCKYGVAGNVYINLNCTGTPEPFGYCGDYCVATQDVFTLQQLIEKSTTPGKGNFTNALYKYWNGTHSIPFPGQPSGFGVGYCYNTSSIEPHPQIYESCNDSDGINPYIRGSCRDIYSREEIYDSCVDGNVGENFCGEGPFIRRYECSSCSKPECKYIGTDSEGWYANCFGQQVLIKYAECGNLPSSYAPVCLNGTFGVGWYEPYRCYSMTMMIENCNCSNGACAANVNCSGWNNSYEIPLGNLYALGLQKTPSKSAYYLLVVNINYNDTFIVPKDSIRAGFFVVEQPRHKACVNYSCVYVAGEGDDECSSDADCSCEPNWSFGPWSACINGVQYANVTDLNGCLPPRIVSRACQVQAVWNCAWQKCNGSIQEKLCVCISNCDASNMSYVAETRVCCVEDWICSQWSKCENGFKKRTCQDVRGCNTTFTKPLEIEACRETKETLLYTLIAILAIVIVFLLIAKTKLTDLLTRKYFVRRSLENFEVPFPPSSRPRLKKEKVESHKFENNYLVEHIKRALRAGFSRQEIETGLLKAGWSKKAIDEAFESLLA